MVGEGATDIDLEKEQVKKMVQEPLQPPILQKYVSIKTLQKADLKVLR